MRIIHMVRASVVALACAGAISAQAAEGSTPPGKFYDPSNPASPTGKTIGYELFRTIGCPGRELLGKPCDVPPPEDTDKDGVPDDKDKCPGTPPGRTVNADGCELDSDGDGVVDGDDKCPTVPAKTADGCPPPAALAPAPAPESAPAALAPAAEPAPPPKLVLDDVNFEYDKAILRPEAFDKLNQAAEGLKQWGNVQVEVAGHTDSRGTEAYNMDLSLRRAEAVRNFLMSQGIPRERMVIKGYGESRPVAENNTDEGRYRNRRVELEPMR